MNNPVGHQVEQTECSGLKPLGELRAGPGAPGFEERLQAVKAEHLAKTGTEPVGVYQAPGRVNLLGEHTDYSGGFCMPAALNFNTLVAASPRTDGLVHLHSLDFGQSAAISLAELEPPQAKGRHAHWSDYCFGVAWSLQKAGVVLKGADLTLQGDVPLGSGLSSSASVEVATATALLAIAQAELSKPRVALACQKAENDYVGAPCGIMDQFISAAGVKGNALAIDTRALTAELAPIPSHLRLVVANTMIKHSVGAGEYGTRRREVEEAARATGVKELRDATLANLQAAQGKMSAEAFKRGRHVITDSQRVLDGLAALRAGNAEKFGRLMSAAHVSYRDDFEASCRQCDLLVELAMTLSGCLGSRLTGGGFGGCTVSLVEAARAEAFARDLQDRYRAATGVTGDIFICEIADGAGAVA